MQCLCGDRKVRSLFQSGNYTIVQCVACGQVRTQSQGKAKRKTLYGTEDIAAYVQKEQMFRQLFGQVIAFIKQFVSSGRLVDIGAGVGLLVDEANKAGFDAIGFEPSKVSVAAAKKYYGVELINCEFRNAKIRSDVIVVNHVLEHVTEPKKLLADAANSIRDGGYLFIGVPHFGSFMSHIKKGRWQNLIPDQHRWHFTLSTLDVLVTPFGFQRVGQTYENHDRSMHPWWKRPTYAILDTMALATGRGEAMLVAYEKL